MERNSTQEYKFEKFETDYRDFMKKKIFPSHEMNNGDVTKIVANLHSEGNLTTTHLSLHNRQSIESLTRENERKSIIIISDSEKSFLENSIQKSENIYSKNNDDNEAEQFRCSICGEDITIYSPVIRQWHLNTCLDTLNVKEKEKPKIINHKNYINDLINNVSQKYMYDLSHFPENLNQTDDKDLGLSWCDPINQSSSALSLKKIMEDYRLKIMDEEKNFERFISNMIKRHKEKVQILLHERNKKIESLLSNGVNNFPIKEIKEISKNSTIEINEINEIQRHWSITEDKEISVNVNRNEFLSSPNWFNSINDDESRPIDISTPENYNYNHFNHFDELEKSFDSFRIDQKPIPVRSSSLESLYHDGDLDNNLGILVYSPSNFQPVKNNSVEKLKENDVITISSTDTSPANNNAITRPKRIQKECDSPIIQSNYNTYEINEKKEQKIEKKDESKKNPDYNIYEIDKRIFEKTDESKQMPNYNIFETTKKMEQKVGKKDESKKMPNYNRMTVVELKAEVAKYGIRPSGKDIMVRQLSYIWKQTNPDESNDIGKDSQPTSSYKSNNKSSYKNIENELTEKSSSSEEESDKNVNSLNSFEDEKKYITKSTDFLLFEKINNYIKREPNLYCSILRYEFVELHELLEKISKAGINCTERQLQYFLDSKGIVNHSVTRQWRKRRTKKNIKVYS
ncbi:hypothetical protein Glove_108g20 [Diversispora epigaea]|uniref:Structure-specific endonuclease subunit SLX4 n=1 Tax=Diversispora epigaea TaxID=1348612 RepID=A0A397J5A0_9GLOM|nr:hypothetical protein Glove_108g20 [Diversispora epigaea]